MHASPLVSVVVPTRNSAATIRATLQSIRNQTYPNIEVVVSDGNSVDNTLTLVREVCPTAKIISSGRERSSQKNDAASASKGEYLYFIDSDFFVNPDVISEAVRGCERGYDAAIVHNTSYPMVSIWARVRKLERDCYYHDQEHVASRFIHRGMFFRVGGFDPAIIAGEDYDLHVRLKMAGAKFYWCENVEFHMGEPRELKEVVTKHVYYGKHILRYARKEFSIRLWQLSPFRRSYVRNLRSFFRDPRLLLGFVLYQYVRYSSAVAGLLSSLASNVTPEFDLSLPQMSGSERSRLNDMVSVVIVTRNRPEAFKRCLGSLKPLLEDIELIVVDDHSEVPYGDEMSGIKMLVRNPRRIFLNASRNVAATVATKPFVLYIDDDNEIVGDCISLLAKMLATFEHVGVASPVVLTDTGKVWFAGGWMSPFSGLAVFNHRGSLPGSLPKRSFESRLFHSCFMIRRKLLFEVGGFDFHNFPMYLGEADLSERISKKAYRIVVDPEAKAIHHIATGSMKGVLRNIHITDPPRAYFVARNRTLFMRRNRGKFVFLAFLLFFQPVIALIHVLTILSGGGSMRTRLLGPYLRGLVDGVAGRPLMGVRLLETT